MRVLGAVALAFGLTATASAQTAQAPTPGQPALPASQQQPSPSTTPQRATPARPLRPGETPPKGSAAIRGQVRAAGTGAPIRRAQVRAFSMDGSGGGGVTNTDNEGNYEIRDLPAGRYSLGASKGGFVQGQYGQRRAGEPGTPIELGEGQIAEKVNFTLPRGGVISGKIVDDGGEPVAGTVVQALQYRYMNGARRLMPSGGEGSNDRTDDQGSFRLYGLAPGDYYVSASNRGGMMVVANVRNTEADSYAPTYYPGTPSVAEAARITVKASQEMSGANFALIVARLARIRGRALNSSGQPVTTGMLMLMPAEPGMMMMTMGPNNAMVGPDGAFQFSNVAPGRYNLTVRPMGMTTSSSETASMPITVGSDDLDNLIVTTSAGATARGVITSDDGTPLDFRAEQVQIFPQPVEPAISFGMNGQNHINDDFTFELTSLSDRRLIRANVPLTTGWHLKQVLLDGNDVTDSGVDFQPGRAYEGLQIVFTRKTTDLSGALTDVFPADPQKWTYSSRYLRTARPDTSGRYAFKSLPPLDDYLIIAVQNLESGQASDPEFLARAKEESRTFSLNEGETKAVDIKLSKLVP
jgi:hypothetical protein